MDWHEFPLTNLKSYGNRNVGSLTIAELKHLRANWMACVTESRRTLSAGELALFQALMEALISHGLEASPSISERKEDPPTLKPSASPPPQGLKLPMPTAPLQPKTVEIAVSQLLPAPIGRRPVSEPAAREPSPADEQASESSDDRRGAVEQMAKRMEQPGQLSALQKDEPSESVSQETENFPRVPLEQIIAAHHTIKGIHPAADLLPLMSDEVFHAVCLDVKAQGFLEPVEITQDDLLLDGRNRIQIGQTLGIDPPIRRVNPPDPVAYVIGKNVSRRHLSVGQRAMVAEKLANFKHGSNQFRKEEVPIGTSSMTQAQAGTLLGSNRFQKVEVPIGTSMTRTQAGTLLGVTPQEISKARIVRELAPREAAKVEQGELSLDAAYKKAKQRIAPQRAKSPATGEAENPEKPAKHKELGNQDDSAAASPDDSGASESEAPTVNPDVIIPSSPVSETSTRQDHLRALWSLFDLLLKGKDESYDQLFLGGQRLDTDKFWAALPRFTRLVRQVKAFAEKQTNN
jgi:hypothetical protein